jgi:uncharacterized delta-60 repeat protein
MQEARAFWAGVLILVGVGADVRAQAGVLDPTFGSWSGKGLYTLTTGGTETARGEAVAVQPDGKIVIAGTVGTASSNGLDFFALRLTSNGDLDSGFGVGGRLIVPFDQGFTDDDQAHDLALQNDGRILVAGYADSGDGDPDFAVLRLDSGGSLDATFGVGGKATIGFDLGGGGTDEAWSVDVAPDLGVLLAGSAVVAIGNTDLAVVRLTATGSVDTSFGTDGKVVVSFDGTSVSQDVAYEVAVQTDGKVLVAGTCLGDFNTDFAVVRLTAGGALDPSFGGDGKVVVPVSAPGSGDAEARSISLRPDGRVLLAGTVWAFPEFDEAQFAAASLHLDGAVNTSFANLGVGVYNMDLGGSGGRDDRGMDAALQADGKLLIAGSVEKGPDDYDLGAIRVGVDGLRDYLHVDAGPIGVALVPFDLPGGGVDECFAIALQADNKMVLVGSAEWPPNRYVVAARLLNDLVFADGFELGDTLAWSNLL